jgi:hypothetical protein
MAKAPKEMKLEPGKGRERRFTELTDNTTFPSDVFKLNSTGIYFGKNEPRSESYTVAYDSETKSIRLKPSQGNNARRVIYNKVNDYWTLKTVALQRKSGLPSGFYRRTANYVYEFVGTEL